MGARGELFTTQIYLENRSYFFNVKENRTGDVFLQITLLSVYSAPEADLRRTPLADRRTNIRRRFLRSLIYPPLTFSAGVL